MLTHPKAAFNPHLEKLSADFAAAADRQKGILSRAHRRHRDWLSSLRPRRSRRAPRWQRPRWEVLCVSCALLCSPSPSFSSFAQTGGVPEIRMPRGASPTAQTYLKSLSKEDRSNSVKHIIRIILLSPSVSIKYA